jgi:hypothetical protein
MKKLDFVDTALVQNMGQTCGSKTVNSTLNIWHIVQSGDNYKLSPCFVGIKYIISMSVYQSLVVSENSFFSVFYLISESKNRDRHRGRFRHPVS